MHLNLNSLLSPYSPTNSYLRTSVQMGNFAHVPNYVSKAEDPQGGLLPLLRENPDLASEFKVFTFPRNSLMIFEL